jgi:ankyrin repeat protein
MTDTHQRLTFEEAHRRIKRSDIVALRHALDSGLDPNLANRFSWTLLMLTAIQGNRPIGELLLARGADLHAKNLVGETALSLAAHGGHESFVRWLLRNGAATDCKPHGWQLADWIDQTSGLRPHKIERVLDLLGLRPSSAKLH